MSPQGADRGAVSFRELLDAAPDAVVCIDERGTIAFFSRQAELLFGYRRDELIGRPLEILIPDRARAIHPALRADYLAAPSARRMGVGTEITGRRKDGSEFPAEIRLNILDAESGRIATAIVRDMTELFALQAERERQRLEAEEAARHEPERPEQELQQSQRLESLGQLAGGVAHDFNNLLGAITNYAHFVGEEVNAAAAGSTDRNWAAVGRDVVQIQRGVERAAALTRQLLTFARREITRPEVLNLNQIVVGLDHLLRRTMGPHVDLVLSLETGLGPISIDPGQVEQILVNLALNARDAMPGGGTVRIETANAHVVEPALPGSGQRFSIGRYVRLRCTDSGVGMSPEVVGRVFEPFFTTRPEGTGTGLGLSTVYGIVAQAGGDVQVESEVGHGTSFTVLFPVSAAAVIEEQAAVETAPAPHVGGGRILLVEDEPLMRDVTLRILERNGYDVVVATEGHQALDLAASLGGSFDLLLTDVVMPQMLGTELAERLRHLQPGLRVLFMSGYAAQALGSAGALDVKLTLLEKPFSEDDLLAKVREVLDAHA